MIERRRPSRRTRGGAPDAVEGPTAERVHEMFNRIARRYDVMNSVMTGGRHRAWRQIAAREVVAAPSGPVLDLATGTADLALAVRALDPARLVVGADFSEGMLAQGMRKLALAGERRVPLVAADALCLPFGDRRFACVASAFLLRNLEDLRRGLAEMRRVTLPGGRLVTLDITAPSVPGWTMVFNLYFQHVVPAIGALVAGDRQAYTYLPQSVARFLAPSALATAMSEVGFRDVRYRRLGLGTIAIHVADI